MAKMGKRYILVDDDEMEGLKTNLEDAGYEIIRHFYHPDGALDLVHSTKPDFIIVDALFNGEDLGARFCKTVCKKFPSLPVAVHTENISNGKVDDVKEYLGLKQLENVKVIFKGHSSKGFLDHLNDFVAMQQGCAEIYDYSSEDLGFVIGTTPAMQKTVKTIIQAASHDSLECLILGETGTGKELVANAIHNLSNRKKNAWIAVNIKAFTPTLIESELFGHVKGAFSGADKDKAGIFERANGGTIFLDEIGDMDLENQAKLLRVLEDRKLTRVGDVKEMTLDVKVVSATKQDLRKLVDDKKFRDDLYFRLCAFQIHLPPLRERTEDIPELCRHFINKENTKTRYEISAELIPSEIERLKNYDWPGNIRQLKKMVQKAHNNAKTEKDPFIESFELEQTQKRHESFSLEEWVEKIYDLDTQTPWDKVEKDVAESNRQDLLMGLIIKLRDENGAFPRKEIAKRIDKTDNMTGQILRKYGINLRELRKNPNF